MTLLKISSVLTQLFLLIPLSSTILFPRMLTVLLCKNKCRSYGGCQLVRYDSNQLQCKLIFGSDLTETKEKGIQILQVRFIKSPIVCGLAEMIFYTRTGFRKCVKASWTCQSRSSKKSKKKKDRNEAGKLGKNEEAPEGNVLYRKNFSQPINHCIHHFPRNVTPGMKITVNGGYWKGLPYSQISLIRSPEKATNPLNWMHICARWDYNKITFTEGFSTDSFKGDFPISDPSNFTFVVEQSLSTTKIYADSVLVKTVKLIPWIEDVVIRKYKQVYALLIQDTG